MFDDDMIKSSIAWRWYDLWIGLYIDTENKKLYICLLPTWVIEVQYA